MCLSCRLTFKLKIVPDTGDIQASSQRHTFVKLKLTQSGASKRGLHSVAVFDSKLPHGNSSCSLFALLHPKLTTLEGELRKTGI